MPSLSPLDGFGPAPGPVPWDRFSAELLALYAPPMRAPATRSQMCRDDRVAGPRPPW